MYQIGDQQSFSQSRIWQLQRRYFEDVGIDAWRHDVVPYYVTSNPVMGKTYAELVLAFLRDLSLRGLHDETVYLLELGAGHGRLCYHFFKHFEKYYEETAIKLPPFCYVLSDFTQANLSFWREHPRLQSYVSKGWLDFALFDMENSSELSLQHAGVTFRPESLSQPLIVVGNYVFDTIPQELFRIENGRIDRCLLTLSTVENPAQLDTADLIEALQCTYGYEETPSTIFPEEPVLNKLLNDYRQQLSSTHLLFPHVGIRCLERLRRLSQQGLLVLSADKGEHHLSDLDNLPPPKLITHGSFSLSVNYHAVQQHCLQQGGMAFFPDYEQANLNLVCLFFLADASTFHETSQAYERFVQDYSPDDFYILKLLIEQHVDTLTVKDILATVRLSGHDAQLFIQMMSRLHDLLPEITAHERGRLFQAIIQIWDTYYSLGEETDLAFDLGVLLLDLQFFQEAVEYFQLSLDTYGMDMNTLFNQAVCHALLGDGEQAERLLHIILNDDPTFEEALNLMSRLNP